MLPLMSHSSKALFSLQNGVWMGVLLPPLSECMGIKGDHAFRAVSTVPGTQRRSKKILAKITVIAFYYSGGHL